MIAELRSIGRIETPYTSLVDCPNNVDPNGPTCRVIIDTEYEDGLIGLHAGQRVLLLYWFDQADRHRLVQDSHDGQGQVGTFALRSPHRPNPIAVAELTITHINGRELTINGLDCLNGTTLLDLKPALR